MLVQISNLHKYYHGTAVLQSVNLTIEDGDHIGLIGENGSGKSTLLRLLVGKELPDHIQEGDGEIIISPKTSIGYLEQISGLDSQSTVWDEMKNVFQPLLTAQEQMHALEKQMQEGDLSGIEMYHQLQTWFESNDGYQIDVKIRMILSGMGFFPEEYGRLISSFSGGEKTRLALAKLLLEAPNLLILDEPTNHLDFKTVMWLEDYLKDYKGTLLLVSHDRFFLDKLSTSICELERGKLTRYKGNYTTSIKLKTAAIERQWKEYEQQQKEIAKLEDYVARNITRASTAKSAQSRVKQLEKMEHIEKPAARQKQARIYFTYEVEPPVEVLKVQDVDISVGSGEQRKLLVSSVSFEIRRGEKWGIIGDNGVGKSTLLKIVQGMLPHSGKIRWTSNVKLSYFDQESANLHSEKSVMQEIHDRVPSWTNLEVRNLLGQVRLTGENVFKPVGVLSGGERAKVCFAVMMLEHGNVLILDEPTNHLDIAMKEIIEAALVDFTGTLLFVSHDRYLLDKVADHILELTPSGVMAKIGGFSDWLAAKQKTKEMEQSVIIEKESSSKENVYHSKKQRSMQAKLHAQMRQLEQNLDEMQAEFDDLAIDLKREEVMQDYQCMQKKCARMEQLRLNMDDYMEQMIAVEEQLSN